MARVFTCGWENGGDDEAANLTPGTAGANGVVTSPVRTGTYAYKRSNATASASATAQYRSTPTAERTFHRFYLYIDTAPSSTEVIYRFGSGGNFRGGVAVNSDRTITLVNQSSVAVGSASPVLSLATWYRVEVDLTADATPLMTATARVDGTDFTSGTTWVPTTGTIDFAGFQGASLAGIFIFDDWAINDTTGTTENSWPGEGKVVYLRATGDGDAATGSPTRGGADSGALWSQVDEVILNEATDYVVLPANPTDFWINVQNGSVYSIGASDTIKVVEVHGQIAGATTTASNWFPQIKKASAGTIASASAVALASATFLVNDDTAATRQCKLTRHTDPDGAAWTPTTLDSMQLSARTTDGNPDTWVSALWAIVEYATAAVVRDPGVGQLTLAGAAPVASIGFVSALLAGTLAFAGAAPTVDVSAGSQIVLPAGSLVHSGAAPSVTVGVVRDIPSGSLAYAGLAPGVFQAYFPALQAGSLAYTGHAPTPVVSRTIETGAGSLALSGVAPNLQFNFVTAIPAGSEVFTGQAPVLSVGFHVALQAGAETFTGHAPSLSSGLAIAIPSGALAYTGQTPVTAVFYTVALPAGALTFTGQAAFPSAGLLVDIPAGTETFTGQTPAATLQITLTLQAGSLVFEGRTPATGNQINVDLVAGALAVSGLAPTLKLDLVIGVPAGTLAFTGHATTLAATVPIQAGALALAGLTPTVAQDRAIALSVGSITVSGLAPTLQTAAAALPAAGTVVLTGLAPTVGISYVLDIPAGSLVWNGHAPTLVSAPTVVLQPEDASLLIIQPRHTTHAIAARLTLHRLSHRNTNDGEG